MEKVKGGGQNNVVTTWTFRDGEQVLVSLAVNENPKSLVIRIANKITAEEWSCQYDLKYIEDLTQRTGNYKSFDVFIAMIKSALLKSTDSVELDLMTYEDLKVLKLKRLNNGGGRFNNGGTDIMSSSGACGKDEDPNANAMSPSPGFTKRKYLIVIYVAEFDSVHYPLPLTHTGGPDPLIMQNNIKRLQSEITFFRNVNQEMAGKIKELEEDGESCNYRARGQGPAQEFQIQGLLEAIRSLEQKSATERMEHLNEIQTLLNENNHLRDQITDLQQSEEDLNLQITRLERMVSQNSRLPPSGASYHQRHVNHQSVVRSGGRESRQEFRNPWNNYEDRSRSRNNPSTAHNSESLERQGSVKSRGPESADRIFSFARSRSRTRSPAAHSKFDPTWYVQEKKMRQAEIAKTRMSQIKSGMPRPDRQFSGSSTPHGSEGGQSPRYAQGGPTHTELRLAARRERSLSRDRDPSLPPSTTAWSKNTDRQRSTERRGQGILVGKQTGVASTTVSAPGKATKPKPPKFGFANVKGTKLGNGPKKVTTTGSTFGNGSKKSAKDIEGSLEALQSYIEDTNQKLSAYKKFGNVFSPEK